MPEGAAREEREPGPGSYFGSKNYNKGFRLNHSGYENKDGLTIRHQKTDIKMWSLAFDVREDCQLGQDLRDGDLVLFHYTNRENFELITKLSGAELRSSFRVEDSKDSYFGHGIYATQKAPHQWPSKDHLLVNNFWPAKKVFQEECPGQPFPNDGDIESLVKDKDGVAFQRIQRLFGEQWEYCIPLIVDQQVAKNVMTETTDAPLMPKDNHGKRKKRLAGYNRFGEKQPHWRDVWIISVYDAEELVAYQPKPKNATQSVEAIVEILHQRMSDLGSSTSIRTKFDGPEFRDLFITLLEKVNEKVHRNSSYWLYLNLAKILEEGDAVHIKGESLDAKQLRERAVQIDPSNAYLDLRLHMNSATVDVGAETLDETQLWIRALEAEPLLSHVYVEFACHLYPEGHPDPQREVQLFGETWDWKRLLAKAVETGSLWAYSFLAERLQEGDTVTIHGEVIDKETVCRMA
eukprot:Skav229742  [mRNA]  locus=scaffold1287:308556:309941:+ [translate_table: standard]